MRKASRMLAALLIPISFFITACGGNDQPAAGGSGAAGGEITIAWPSQPPTLDPVVVTTSATNTIAYNVFEGLVAMDANYAVQPMLAESWQANDDYTKFTFKMRTGVKFHNGKEMTTDDVIASIDYWIKVTSAGKQFFTGAKVESPEANVITITLPKTLYTGIFYMAQPIQQLVIMPAESIEKAEPSTGVPIKYLFGTGPYKVESMTVDQEIVLVRNADYSSRTEKPSGITGAKTPKADKLIFKIVPDATTRVNGIMSGQYDYASDIPADNASQLSSAAGVKLHTLDSGILAMIFNKKQGPFANQTLRQAAQVAVNATDVLNSSYHSTDYYQLNGALAAPNQSDWYTKEGTEHYDLHDMAKAKELVAQSGYKGEEIRFITTRDYPYMYNSAVVVSDVFKEMGLNVKLEVTDWASELKSINDPAGAHVFISDFMKRPIPSAYTYLTPTYAGWTDEPAITTAIDHINAATSTQAGIAAVGELQKAMDVYVPAVKFGDIRAITAQRDTVDGFIPFIGPVFYDSYRVA